MPAPPGRKKSTATRSRTTRPSQARTTRETTEVDNNSSILGVLAAVLATALVMLLIFMGWRSIVDFDKSNDQLTAQEIREIVREESSGTPTSGQTVFADPVDETSSNASSDSFDKAYDVAGGIPYNGTDWNVDVAPDELEVFTGGPMSIDGTSLSGGETRGSVIVFLPDPNKVVHYTVNDVIAGSNWHASYRPLDPQSKSTWSALADFTVANMHKAPNCTPGKGCSVVDVLIVGPNGIIANWTA